MSKENSPKEEGRQTLGVDTDLMAGGKVLRLRGCKGMRKVGHNLLVFPSSKPTIMSIYMLIKQI